MRRSIGSDLQIYFDEHDTGKAKYFSKTTKPLPAVIAELENWREFIDDWLQKVEEPSGIRLSPVEVKCLLAVGKQFKDSGTPMEKIEVLLESVIRAILKETRLESNFSVEQVRLATGEVVAKL